MPSVIQQIVATWREGNPLVSPMDDCQRLELALKKASSDDKDVLMLNAPEILRSRSVDESVNNAIRFEVMNAVHRLFRTGYRPSKPEWLTDLCTFTLVDPYEHVGFALQDLVRDFPNVFEEKTLSDLCEWKCKIEHEFARLGGEERFSVLQADFCQLSSKLNRKIKEKIEETVREIAEIEASLAEFAQRLTVASIEEKEKLLSERLAALRKQSGLQDQVRDRFSMHFPQLREKLRRVEHPLKTMEPFRRALERCPKVFGQDKRPL